MSRTEKMRRLARRLRVEEGRLRKIAADMAEWPMTARDIRRYAGAVGVLSISLDSLATVVRDKRGANPTTEKP